MKNSITLNRSHDLSAFAAVDSGGETARFVLTGILVNPTAGVVAATNGRFIAEAPLESSDDSTGFLFDSVQKDEIKPCIIPAPFINNALASVKTISMAKSGKQIIIQSDRNKTEVLQTAVAIEGDYPNYVRLFEEFKSDRSICLSPKYLKAIADYAFRNGRKDS